MDSCSAVGFKNAQVEWKNELFQAKTVFNYLTAFLNLALKINVFS